MEIESHVAKDLNKSKMDTHVQSWSQLFTLMKVYNVEYLLKKKKSSETAFFK